MIPLLILAVLLFACWLWAMWKRSGSAAFMREWNYVPLVGAVTCVLMAIGLGIR